MNYTLACYYPHAQPTLLRDIMTGIGKHLNHFKATHIVRLHVNGKMVRIYISSDQKWLWHLNGNLIFRIIVAVFSLSLKLHYRFFVWGLQHHHRVLLENWMEGKDHCGGLSWRGAINRISWLSQHCWYSRKEMPRSCGLAKKWWNPKMLYSTHWNLQQVKVLCDKNDKCFAGSPRQIFTEMFPLWFLCITTHR